MPHVPVFPHLGPLRQADEPYRDRHASGGPRPGADHHPTSDCHGPGAGRYLGITAARERGSATLLNAARERGTGHLAAPEPLWPLDCGASGAIGRSDDDSFALVACSRLSAAAARERGSATLLNTARERGGSHLAVPEPPRPSERDSTGTMRPPNDLSGSDILPVGAIAVQAHGTPIYPLGPVATRSFDALVAFTAAASALQGSLGKHAARLRGAVRTGSAPPRDILPLPPVLVSDLDHRCDLPPPLRQVLLAYANVSIAALNSLGSCSASAPVLPASKVQRVALTNVVSKVANMWDRLMTLSDVDLEPAGAIWQLVSDPAVRPLNASLIDTPDVAAQCDPMPHLDEETRARILAPTGVFSSAPTRLLRFPGISGSERRQYIALVVVQLRAGKLALSSRILAGASVFGRVKSDGKRMREIWNGSLVSQAATRPPPPPDPVPPSCFAYQEVEPGQRLRASKRDAKCWFDQLKLPDHLQLYMGRPRVRRAELLAAGMTPAELTSVCRRPGDQHADAWYPVAQVWGMGFSWSSTVAQQTLLSVCREAGLGSSVILSPERAVPASTHLQFGVATDDALIFSTVPGASVRAAERLDHEFRRAGVVRNEAKDVNDALNATCVGVDLVDGRMWNAPPQRILAAIEDLTVLMERPHCAPLVMAAYLGKLTWYDLLCRPKLSCYQVVYEFTRRADGTAPVSVPREVTDELFTSVALTPWWTVPLERPFHNTVLATDASTDYGFGGAAMDFELDELRQLSRLCSKAGDRVVLDPPGDVVGASGLGKRHRLGASKHEFRTVFSIPAKFKTHINIMEVGALNMGLKWWLRNPARHDRRLVLLLDSKVALGGAAKGRSSSGPLLHALRQTAALVMAGALQPYYVFIGTRDNPADKPSRGCSTRARDTRLVRKVHTLKR